MRKMLIAFLALPLAQTAASAQTAGDAAAGKAYWDRLAPRLTDCKDCHGLNGEGGFGPDLAGRGLNAAQIERAVRQPWGVMPAFVESQVSEKDAADLAAYFASLPKPAAPGKWRVEVPAGAPPGQATMINMGCGQCHGATFNGPRGNSWALSGMDFDYFANLVYNHTTAMPQYRADARQITPPIWTWAISRRSRLTVGQLRQIYFWARDEIGVRAPMAGQIAKGETGPSGVTYPVTISEQRPPGQRRDRGGLDDQPHDPGRHHRGGGDRHRISGHAHRRQDQGHRRHVEVAAQRPQGSGEAQHHALQGRDRRRQSQGRHPLDQAGAEERPERRRGQYRAGATLAEDTGGPVWRACRPSREATVPARSATSSPRHATQIPRSPAGLTHFKSNKPLPPASTILPDRRRPWCWRPGGPPFHDRDWHRCPREGVGRSRFNQSPIGQSVMTSLTMARIIR